MCSLQITFAKVYKPYAVLRLAKFSEKWHSKQSTAATVVILGLATLADVKQTESIQICVASCKVTKVRTVSAAPFTVSCYIVSSAAENMCQCWKSLNCF
jgi:hypothetical protein